MIKVKTGDTVKVKYTGYLDDGTVFSKSEEEEPLKFTVGNDEIIPGFEDAVLGLSPGDSVEVNVNSDEAYGQHLDELVVVVNREDLPEDLTPEVGQRLDIHQENGNPLPVIVTDVNEKVITLDANHPLAGKDLKFNIELLDILE